MGPQENARGWLWDLREVKAGPEHGKSAGDLTRVGELVLGVWGKASGGAPLEHDGSG